MEWLSAFTAAACALSAVLAWIAKIYWSKEFATAKDEIIRAKDVQIALLEREITSLKEMSPMKIREYFNSVKEQLTEYIEALKTDLKKAHSEIQNRDKQITDLKQLGGDQEEIILCLEGERQRLESSVVAIEYALTRAIAPSETSKASLTFSNSIGLIEKNYSTLRNNLSHTSSNKNSHFNAVANAVAAWDEAKDSLFRLNSGINFSDLKTIFEDKKKE